MVINHLLIGMILQVVIYSFEFPTISPMEKLPVPRFRENENTDDVR